MMEEIMENSWRWRIQGDWKLGRRAPGLDWTWHLGTTSRCHGVCPESASREGGRGDGAGKGSRTLHFPDRFLKSVCPDTTKPHPKVSRGCC